MIDGCKTPRYNQDMPNKRAENMRNVTTTFDKDDLAKVDAAARAAGMTRSEYMRLAALKLMEELAKQTEHTDQ